MDLEMPALPSDEDQPLARQASELSREVRFGLVLYGGVSLAVYENGVVQEFFQASKGAGIYTILKHLADSDIVVDIVSGASAGGINGVLLGYALANNLDLASSAALWRDDGDILKLLHQPSDFPLNSALKSVDYFQKHLEQAFTKFTAYAKQPNDLESAVEQLDLFVAGTNVYGHVYTEFDDLGEAIDVKNHRVTFHLRHSKALKAKSDLLHTKDLRAYAKLCRLTSAFPVAFEPVEVGADNATPTEKQVDELLIEWGRLTQTTNTFFLDGGILDNKPFSSTLRAIFHHTETREVDRFLAYVEPDPERFLEKEGSRHSSPNVIESGGDGLSRLPSYQSIGADLDQIADHNDWAQRYRDIVEQIGEGARKNLQPPTGLSPVQVSQDALYQRARFSQVRGPCH